MLRQKGHGAGQSLFRVIVDQFLAREMHPERDVAQFERLALGLMERLDTETIATVARQLCVHPETPRSIVVKLYEMGGRTALIALEFAPKISSDDLLVRAAHGASEEAVAIARRIDLDHGIISALASRREVEILWSLAANRRAFFDPVTLCALTLAGRDDLRLGRILLDRGESALDIEPLFLAANHMERAAIILEATKSAFVDSAADAAPKASGAAIAKALERAALAGGLEAAADVLTDALDCGRSLALAILADKSGEALALALVVFGVSEEAAIRVLLRADSRIVYDVARVRSLVGLMRFIPLHAAKRIVASMTGTMYVRKEPPCRSPISDVANPSYSSGVISRLASVA
jgi:uncharacterized protein (DUF2336 family)